MKVINRIDLIFIIDFFEASIDEGYDRECQIGKSTEGILNRKDLNSVLVCSVSNG
jgi:hypothetical protein